MYKLSITIFLKAKTQQTKILVKYIQLYREMNAECKRTTELNKLSKTSILDIATVVDGHSHVLCGRQIFVFHRTKLGH